VIAHGDRHSGVLQVASAAAEKVTLRGACDFVSSDGRKVSLALTNHTGLSYFGSYVEGILMRIITSPRNDKAAVS